MLRRAVENINIKISLVLEKTDISKRMIFSAGAIYSFRDPSVLVGAEGYFGRLRSHTTPFNLLPTIPQNRYDLLCQSSGSRPPATITWSRNGQRLDKTKETTDKDGEIRDRSRSAVLWEVFRNGFPISLNANANWDSNTEIPDMGHQVFCESNIRDHLATGANISSSITLEHLSLWLLQTSTDGNTTTSTLSFSATKEDAGTYLACKAENKAVSSEGLEDAPGEQSCQACVYNRLHRSQAHGTAHTTMFVSPVFHKFYRDLKTLKSARNVHPDIIAEEREDGDDYLCVGQCLLDTKKINHGRNILGKIPVE
uniref:Ig-like domain-containing protein n=1 Tax=Timema shepardi TaxID=629360 RepID=A0A7R9ASN1_TIMSH|nr:unnamed protein product [Timema shepardi]